MALTYVAAYDIREDPRRARVAAVLQAYGDRIQKSVFLLKVDRDELREITERVGATMDLATDSFYAFPQCEECWTDVALIGQTRAPDDEVCWLAF